MDISCGLAFVDVETTGLQPGADRIAEVAVVTLDGDRVERWSSAVDAYHAGHARSSWRAGAPEWATAPRFAQIASVLAERIGERLVIAHNARFDLAFLRAELAAAGIAFAPRIVCSVMLSRRLCPDLPRHDLDALAAAHGLAVTVRHRALPDAELLLAWWRAVVARMPEPVVAHALRTLLAGPLLPAGLDPTIVDALPECPGAFTMLDARGEPLHVGAAANLRAHAVAYFRVGRATGCAVAIAHRVHRIAWRRTRGVLGARLVALAAPPMRARHDAGFTWRLDPARVPCVTIVPATEEHEGYGCFGSRRKARNALARIATREGLCRCLLGIGGDETRVTIGGDRADATGAAERERRADCRANIASPGAEDAAVATCVQNCAAVREPGVARGRALVQVLRALRSLRIDAWPYAGPIGLRDGSDLIVVDRWRFLGIARNEAEAFELVGVRHPPFDPRTYRLLRRALSRVPGSRRIALHPPRAACVGGE